MIEIVEGLRKEVTAQQTQARAALAQAEAQCANLRNILQQCHGAIVAIDAVGAKLKAAEGVTLRDGDPARDLGEVMASAYADGGPAPDGYTTPLIDPDDIDPKLATVTPIRP